MSWFFKIELFFYCWKLDYCFFLKSYNINTWKLDYCFFLKSYNINTWNNKFKTFRRCKHLVFWKNHEKTYINFKIPCHRDPGTVAKCTERLGHNLKG